MLMCIDDWYKLFSCEVLIEFMFRLWFVKRESELIFTSSYEGVYLKAESSNKNTEYMPGGQIKPNIITVFDKKVCHELLEWVNI